MKNLECNMSKDGILSNLYKGLESEKTAMDLCLTLSYIVKDEESKGDLQRIAADEARHIKITEELIEIVKTEYKES